MITGFRAKTAFRSFLDKKSTLTLRYQVFEGISSQSLFYSENPGQLLDSCEKKSSELTFGFHYQKLLTFFF